MPFYEYQCAACGHHHEELQKVTDRPLRKCPACGRAALKRLVSAPVFRLKGAGWYETDFKGDKEAKRNIAGEKEPAAAGSSPAEKPKDEKTEAKPAEKKPDAGAAAKPDVAAKKPKPARPKRARRRPLRR
ncbi:MAG TPA: FmdB family zinc ribbon protein [Steroidobacteraceae bacterium]|jgi:putative FmdB family regulatory protein|nr:FmdB family zinc ribbon protein [Steroidobacteraceae bacterium]